MNEQPPDSPAGEPEPHGAGGAGFVPAFLAGADRLRRIVAGMGFAPADADDILQDIYLEISRVGGTYRGPAEATGWLVRATVNRCLLEYRRRRRFRRAAMQILRDQPDESSGPPPDQAAIRAEELEAVRQAMHDLGATLLVPLALRYFSEMNAAEIGETLNLPASTVRSRLREARLILADMLMARGFEP